MRINMNESGLSALGFLPIRGYPCSFAAEMSFPLRGGKIAAPTLWKSACVSHSRRYSIDRQEYGVKQFLLITGARFGLSIFSPPAGQQFDL
jgi:hypothetical protein